MTHVSSLPDATPTTAVMVAHPPARRAWIERMRLLNVSLVFILIALCLSWELWLAPLKGGSGALALKCIPLTFAIGGMLKHRLYTYRWMSLLIWLYFTEGVVRTTGDKGASQWLAGMELALSVALFAGCATYVRLRLKGLPKPAKGQPSHSP
jgi:uncharacterized membrane protein